MLGVTFGIEGSTTYFYATKMEEKLDLHEIFNKHGVTYKGVYSSPPFLFRFLLDKKIEFIPEEINHFVLENENLSCNIPVRFVFMEQINKSNIPIHPSNFCIENSAGQSEYYQPFFKKYYWFWKYFVLLPEIPD